MRKWDILIRCSPTPLFHVQLRAFHTELTFRVEKRKLKLGLKKDGEEKYMKIFTKRLTTPGRGAEPRKNDSFDLSNSTIESKKKEE